jgi:Methyltransferase domain
MPPDNPARHAFLAALHDRLQPSTYLEIGVNTGKSLALSRVPSIAVDPAFSVTSEIRADVHLVRATSDDFFARPDPLEHFRGRSRASANEVAAPAPGAEREPPPIDLAFIDGLHLFEFAFRDFMNVERYSAPASVIVFDDMLPRTVEEAARNRTTRAWAGDVYKVIGVLRRYRPELLVIPVDTRPTGLLVVLAPDAASTVLRERYDEILSANVGGDPQPVPEAILRREGAVDPARLLASGVWAAIVEARRTGTSRGELEGILRAELQPVLDAGRRPGTA